VKKIVCSFFWCINFKTPFLREGSNPVKRNGKPFLVNLVKVKRINCDEFHDNRKRKAGSEGFPHRFLLSEGQPGDESANTFIGFPCWNVTSPYRSGNPAVLIAHTMHTIPAVCL